MSDAQPSRTPSDADDRPKDQRHAERENLPSDAAQPAEGPTGERLSAQLARSLHEHLSLKRPTAELVVQTLLAGGHLLLDDVPGVGKTTLARALARLVGGTTTRIQFTSDLLPSDLTGVGVFDRSKGDFVFRPGPLFANVVIADEINRASPKTQSAMLEAMNEGTVSVDGVTHTLPRPFFVIATQNPVESEGTYPLPDAQLDRFMTCTSMGYPPREIEISMLVSPSRTDPLEGLDQVCTPEELLRERARIARIHVSLDVGEYTQRLIEGTRTSPDVAIGASPRAGMALVALARARADIRGRDFVIPDDVRDCFLPTISHRLVLEAGADAESGDARADEILTSILRTTTVPMGSLADDDFPRSRTHRRGARKTGTGRSDADRSTDMGAGASGTASPSKSGSRLSSLLHRRER